MAPEQACGLRDQIDHRSDQFSLAAIAYTLLTGQEPFRGENPIAVLYEVVHNDPMLPSEVVPALGPEIDAVMMRGLAKESADRYPDVLAFASALRAAVQGATPRRSWIRSASRRRCGAAPGADRRRAEPVARCRRPRRPASRSMSMSIWRRRAPTAGRDTVRLIRRMRWRMNKTPQRVALLALAAAAAFAWFSPATRVPTRAAWQRAGTQMHIMIERVLPNRELRP